jgi:hypothetical protein
LELGGNGTVRRESETPMRPNGFVAEADFAP